MSPSLRVLPKAFVLAVCSALFVVAPASAQFYESVLKSVDASNDLARSPRLLGMGQLSLAVPDRGNALTLWDFAASPVGLGQHDSTSTLDLYPGTNSASGAHDAMDGHYRQDLGARGTRMGFETMRRDDEGNGFGIVGTFSGITSATPYAADQVLQRQVSHPVLMPVITGKFPYFGHGRMRYALRMQFGGDHLLDKYRAIVSNLGGDFLTLDGATLNPPDDFNPDEYKVSRTSLGASLSYPVARDHVLAIGFDGVRQRINGTNDGNRYTSEISERRPYGIGQASLLGHFGKSLEYGLDARRWHSQSEQKWVFSISAGVGSFPLEGRGKLQTREETGDQFNGRFRWTHDKFELGGQVFTQASRVSLDPPAGSDRTSLNYFINSVWYRPGIDSLARPDSAVTVRTLDHTVGYGLGVSYHVARGILGVEYHWRRDLHETNLNGLGPRPVQWDVRTGLEYPCSKVMTSRIGYVHRSVDRDNLTAQNEFIGNALTFGIGLHPVGTRWSFESGYLIEFMRSDFGDPTQQRSSRQDLAMQLHYSF